MGKYEKKCVKAPKKRRKVGGIVFAVMMVLYAAAFLVGTKYFLEWLWGCMEAYEATRPKGTMAAYMEQLTKEHICDVALENITGVDENIQSREEMREYMLSSLDGQLSYAKKSRESTETKQVFVLRCGGKVIGSYTMTSGTADPYGFTPWEVTEESFDLSYLIGTEGSVTAPAGYPVYANGVLLDERYVTGTETVPYDVFEEFYDDYDLPSFEKVTYTVGPVLGELTLSVTDPEGNPYTLDETVDINAFVDNCTEEEVIALDAFVADYLDRYVVFSGSANDAAYYNYTKLIELVVEDSKLAQRMYDAIEGLQFAQSKSDTIQSIDMHHCVNMGEGKYLCDITYLVDTWGHEGIVQTTNNVKLLVVQTDSGLKAETMISY